MEASLPGSRNSPGPPDMASHGATADEDSQESMTLQNALPPLPDTQRDSPEHDLSSPIGQDGTVQLLSRPQNLDIDPGESFSWGKPVKIIPGQFSRPPAKSTVDAVKGRVPSTSPVAVGVPSSEAPDSIAGASIQSTHFATRRIGHVISHNSRNIPVKESSHATLPNVEGSLKGENDQPAANDAGHPNQVQAFARRPPFEDYQPQHQRLDGKDRTPVTNSPRSREFIIPEHLGMGETQHYGAPEVQGQMYQQGMAFSEQGAGSNHSVKKHPQQGQPTDSAHINKPRHRMSLPNDTSVSPAQPARQLPRQKSQHDVLHEGHAQKKTLGESPPHNLNRPMRDVRQKSKTRTPIHCPSTRSTMHGSNISKRRSRPHPSASNSTGRSRRQDSRHRDETPSIRRRAHQSAANHRDSPLENDQQSYVPPEIGMLAGTVAQALNGFCGWFTSEWRRKDQDISYLERNLRKKEGKLSNFSKESDGKARRILELEDDRTRLQERLETASQQLDDRSNKVSDLQKKCRTYKDHLNAATTEQQDLYKAAKAKCENAIKQMREEEHKRMALDEQHRKDLQATRERLAQVVKSTVAEYSLKEREYNNKFESLHQKVQEREADVERERETIRSLLEQNATVESVKGAVKTFEAQIEQITTKMAEIARSRVERDETAAEDTRVKLDKIVEHLAVLDERLEPQAGIVEKIKKVNVQTFSTILNPVLESQTEMQANLQKLSDAVEDYMQDFWMKLEDREDVLTELLEQTQADNAQLQADVQLREDECHVLLGRLEEAEATTRQREESLENLKNDISELERAQANDMEQAARANLLHEDCEKLKVDVAAKAALAHDLEIKLQQSQDALLKGTEQHNRHSQELRNLMEQRDEAARLAQDAAVEVARQEVTRDMTTAKQNISTLLKQAETEGRTLKDELNAAKQQLAVVEETNKRADTKVVEPRSELETAQAKANRLSEEANEKDMEIQKAIEHSSVQVTDLEGRIARKEMQIAQLSEDAQAYDKQVQKALNSLKDWAKDRQDVKGFISALGEAQDGHLDSIEPKLKAVLEIDMLHQAIFRWCEARGRSAPTGNRGAADESTTGQDVWADLPSSSAQQHIPSKSLATRILDQVCRRVTIRSPNQSAPSPMPPSISAEQEYRRSADPPRSIMKASSQSTNIEGEDHVEPRAAAQSSSLPSRGFFGRRTYKALALAKAARQEDGERREENVQDKATFTRSDFTRAPYNRPVSSTNPRAESLTIDDGTRVGREPRKRKHAGNAEMRLPTKRVSIATGKESSRPLIYHLSPPERQVSKGDESEVPPSAPRKRSRKHKDMPGDFSPVRSFYFNQSISAAEREARRKGPNQRGAEVTNMGGRKAFLAPGTNSDSQDSSQGSQSLDYPRHRFSRQDEDSQDSITHSQRVTSEPADPHYPARRFTMSQ